MKVKLDTTVAKKAKAELIQKGKTLDLVETDSPLTSIWALGKKIKPKELKYE